jgi:hypothetical protein
MQQIVEFRLVTQRQHDREVQALGNRKQPQQRGLPIHDSLADVTRHNGVLSLSWS